MARHRAPSLEMELCMFGEAVELAWNAVGHAGAMHPVEESLF
jgi:hypothetical protein